MKFAAKTEAEVNNLLPDGIYDAEVGTAEDQVSKSGNDMIMLDLTIFGPTGNQKFVKDYLLEAMAYKLRHAASAFDMLTKYEEGNLSADDFIGKSCKVKIKTDAKDPAYPPKNVVSDYMVDERPKEPKAIDEVLKGDALPF